MLKTWPAVAKWYLNQTKLYLDFTFHTDKIATQSALQDVTLQPQWQLNPTEVGAPRFIKSSNTVKQTQIEKHAAV